MAQNHDRPIVTPPALGALLSIVAQHVCELDARDARDPSRSHQPPSSPQRLRFLVEAGRPTVLTVAAGGPTVRVEIEQKVSHDELRRIARIMRERWKDGQGEFAVPSRGARQDLAWREVQLRVATTFVFFYLPGMDFERDNAWALVAILPDGTAKVTIISPER